MQIAPISVNKFNSSRNQRASFSGSLSLRIPVVRAKVVSATVGQDKSEIRAVLAEARSLIAQLGEGNSLCKGLKDAIASAEAQLKK